MGPRFLIPRLKWPLRCLVVLTAAFGIIPRGHATTLAPMTGDAQLQKAETIFRGRVDRVDMARDWSKSRGPVISTVRFTPLAVYKGTVSGPISLKFLGGQADGMTLKVEGMPEFEAGKEYVLFVSAQKNVMCPLVGWTEGSLKVDYGTNAAGAVPVSSTAASWLQHTAAMTKDRAVMPPTLKLSQFESLLRSRLSDLGAAK